MGGGVFTYIVDLANELVNKYDMYIAYAVRKQTPKNYKDYFDKRIHLIEVKNFGRAINPTKDIAAFFEVKKIAAEVKTGCDSSMEDFIAEKCRKVALADHVKLHRTP